MAIVNISLPDQMKKYIEERMSEGRYNTTSEYFRDLIHEDQKRQAGDRLEALLMSGLESPIREWTKEDADDIKNALQERLVAKQKNELAAKR